MRTGLTALAYAAALVPLSAAALPDGGDLSPLPLNNRDALPPVKAGLWAVPEVIDENGDGKPDLYVSSPDTVNGCSWYFENRGDGVFRRGMRRPLRRSMGVEPQKAWNCPDEDSDGTPITDPRSAKWAAVEPARADWDGDGDEDVVAGSFTGIFFYYENTGGAGLPAYAPQRKLFEAESCMVKAVAADWDGDGRPDIVFGDENGHVSWARNTGRLVDGAPTFDPPRLLLQEDSDLECNVLAAPFAVDWDGDGDLDFVCGDSPGFLSLVENLSGPGVAVPRWALPRRFTAGGRPLRFQAGLDGSILGQHERKFGYTSASVADWDGDGLLDLMAGDIKGHVTLFRGKGGGLDLAPGERLDVTQAWRCRPLMVDWNRDGLMDLATVDLDGYVVFHERFRRPDGSLALKPPDFRFVYEDGSPVKVNFRPRGHGGSGRRKFQFVDWDGDGRLDLVCSAWSADFRRQIGERDGKTVFARPVELCRRRLAGHETCPTAVDFEGRGVPDLVIGAEDGRFYLKRNDKGKRAK